jgi:hypothetical protein
MDEAKLFTFLFDGVMTYAQAKAIMDLVEEKATAEGLDLGGGFVSIKEADDVSEAA